MLDKIKKGAKDAKDNADLETAYIKCKKDGFPHPPEVEEHIDIYRGMRDEIPKLRDRIGNFDSAYKTLAEYEEKISDDFLAYLEIPMQNPQISSIYRTYAEGKRQMSQKRFTMQAMFNEINAEWKPLESEGLKDIKSKQDKANRTCSDLKVYEKKNKSAKVLETNQLYEMLSTELIDLVHILRVKKEVQIPAFLMRLAAAEAKFFRDAADIASAVEGQLINIGPVTVQPNIFGSLSGHSSQNNSNNYSQPQQSGPPPIQRSGPQVRGMYDFNAESPQEVSFRAGEILNLVSGQGDWWTVELRGQTGLVPANYVQMV